MLILRFAVREAAESATYTSLDSLCGVFFACGLQQYIVAFPVVGVYIHTCTYMQLHTYLLRALAASIVATHTSGRPTAVLSGKASQQIS